MSSTEGDGLYLITRLAGIEPELTGYRKAQAARIIQQNKKGRSMAGWQDDARAIIRHYEDAEKAKREEFRDLARGLGMDRLADELS